MRPSVIVLIVHHQHSLREGPLALEASRGLHDRPPVVPDLIVFGVSVGEVVEELELEGVVGAEGAQTVSTVLPSVCGCRFRYK